MVQFNLPPNSKILKENILKIKTVLQISRSFIFIDGIQMRMKIQEKTRMKSI